MSKVLQLSYVELQKVSMRPFIYLALGLAAIASIGMGVEVLNGQTFGMSHIFIFFAMVAEWVIVYYASKSLGEEFSAKTSTLIFTKAVSRKKIILSKLLSLAGIGMVFGVISSMIATIFQYIITSDISASFLVQDAIYNLVAYVLFTLLVGSFGLLASLITMNATSSLLITLLAFQFAPAIIEMIVGKFEFLKSLSNYIPFYTAVSFLEQHQFQRDHLIGIAVGILLFTVSSLYLIDKKDLI
ncbi:ABC transporter permease subunit [Erwinia sp. CPCC 100877]|jgi:ABC-2 type transport system permease protein|nr:ABC transporter permease subunit [Erwinia sp. CPCC 100877]